MTCHLAYNTVAVFPVECHPSCQAPVATEAGLSSCWAVILVWCEFQLDVGKWEWNEGILDRVVVNSQDCV